MDETKAQGDMRDQLTQRIVELSDNRLSIKPNDGYFALKIGNRIAATVHDDRTSFYIPSTELLQKMRELKKRVEEAPQTKPRNKNWYRVHGLNLGDVQDNEVLFRSIILESIGCVEPKRRMN